MSAPTISLVIPSFNRGDLIGETIESALSQEPPFHQVIIVDDGSTDDTQLQLKTFGGSISCAKTANRGVQAARNTGVTLANSDYVALCDSDDLLLPGYVGEMQSWLGEHSEVDIAYCNFVNFDTLTASPPKFSQAPPGYFDGAQQSGSFLYQIPELYERCIEFQPMFPSGSITRRTFFQKIGGYDERFKGVGAEDWEFCLRAICNGETALCTKPLVKIRRHAGNDSASALHMNIGEARILEFALAHHPCAAQYAGLVRDGIRERRIRAFDGAYAAGNLDLAESLLQQLGEAPPGIKAAFKRAVLRSPALLRQSLWKLSVRC